MTFRGWPVALAVLLVLPGCSRARYGTLDLVPGDAVAAVEFRWREARANAGLKQFTELPVWIEFSKLGLSLSSLDAVVLFSRSLTMTADRGTAILSGSRLGRDFVQVADAPHGWTPESMGSTRGFVRSDGSNLAAASMGDDIIVIGSKDEIRHFARSGANTGAFVAKPEFANVRVLFGDSSPIRVALAWPDGVADGAEMAVGMSAELLKSAGWPLAASVVEKLGIGRAYVVRLNPQPGGVSFNIAGVMRDDSTAAIVTGSLSLLKGLASLMPSQEPQRQADVVSTLTIQRTGTIVQVGMVVPNPAPR